MKRKVKKGVKMLTSLIEGTMTYDANHIMLTSSPVSASAKNNAIVLPVNKTKEANKLTLDPNA